MTYTSILTYTLLIILYLILAIIVVMGVFQNNDFKFDMQRQYAKDKATQAQEIQDMNTKIDTHEHLKEPLDLPLVEPEEISWNPEDYYVPEDIYVEPIIPTCLRFERFFENKVCVEWDLIN